MKFNQTDVEFLEHFYAKEAYPTMDQKVFVYRKHTYT